MLKKKTFSIAVTNWLGERLKNSQKKVANKEKFYEVKKKYS